MSGNTNGDRSNGITFGRHSDRASSKLSRSLRMYVDRDFDAPDELRRGHRRDEERDVDAPDEAPPGWSEP